MSYLKTCYPTTYKETGRDDVLKTLHYWHTMILKKKPRVLISIIVCQ